MLVALVLLAACGGADTTDTTTTVSIEEGTPAAPAPATDTAPAGPAPVAFDTAAARGERPLLREIYYWDAADRDPFRPLFVSERGGPEFPDLVLTSVLYQPSNPSRSVAVFSDRGSTRRYTVTQGQRIGRLTVVEIAPGTVVLRMNDFGTIRDQTYQVRRSEDGTP
jgi:hypothetical protein